MDAGEVRSIALFNLFKVIQSSLCNSFDEYALFVKIYHTIVQENN